MNIHWVDKPHGTMKLGHIRVCFDEISLMFTVINGEVHPMHRLCEKTNENKERPMCWINPNVKSVHRYLMPCYIIPEAMLTEIKNNLPPSPPVASPSVA